MTEQMAIVLPDLGEGLMEAQVVSWYVGLDELVVEDQPLLAVETDKAVVDIPAPQAGKMTELCVAVDATIAVGTVLARMAVESAHIAHKDPDDAAPADSGAIVGDLPNGALESLRPVVAGRHPGSASSPRLSPRARRRAKELGVDLRLLAENRNGRTISVADVERSAAVTTEFVLRGTRRSMARRMQDAHARVARANITDAVEVSSWWSKITARSLLLRLVHAVGVAARSQPLLNAQFDDEHLTLTPADSVDVGVAMETDQGLVVPVLRNVQNLSLAQIEVQLQRLRSAAQQRTLTPQDLANPTISVSNYGSVGGRYADMVVVPPQVAIVGAGRVVDVPVARDGVVAIAAQLPLSLSFDHRAITGVEACRFLNALAAELGLPEQESSEVAPETSLEKHA